MSASHTAPNRLCVCCRTGDISWLIDKGSQWPTCLEVTGAVPPPSVAPTVISCPSWADWRGHQRTATNSALLPDATILWSLDYLWGAEDTKLPPLTLITSSFWTWLQWNCLPFFMRHQERQQPCVHITMYDIVCTIFWTDFNCNCMRTCNNTKHTQKNQPRISKKMFLKAAHLLAAVLQKL